MIPPSTLHVKVVFSPMRGATFCGVLGDVGLWGSWPGCVTETISWSIRNNSLVSSHTHRQSREHILFLLHQVVNWQHYDEAITQTYLRPEAIKLRICIPFCYCVRARITTSKIVSNRSRHVRMRLQWCLQWLDGVCAEGWQERRSHDCCMMM